MLPVTLRGLAGTRLLQEYFAFPQRFLFIDIADLGAAFAKATRQHLRDRSALQPLRRVARGRGRGRQLPACTACRRSTCSSAAPTACISTTAPPRTTSFRSAPPRSTTRSSTSSACAASARTARSSCSMPLFAAPQAEPNADIAYYSAAREPRLPSDRGKRDGPRSGYVGTEVFLSLVDSREVPYRSVLRQLGVQIAVHQSRPAALHADRPGARRAQSQHQCADRIDPHRRRAVAPAERDARGRDRLAPARLAVAQLPVASRERPGDRRDDAARDPFAVRDRRRRRPEAADRRRSFDRRQAGGAPPSRWPGRSPSAAAWRSA